MKVTISGRARYAALALGIVVSCAAVAVASAQSASSPGDLRARAKTMSLGSLRTVAIPDPPNFSRFVNDRLALRQLGKALFWDEQVGSDRQACASCHFHAGVDNRSKNQLNPGLRGGDTAFTPPFSPDYQLGLADFPLHGVTRDTNDVASSQGVFNAAFAGLGGPPRFIDQGTPSLGGFGAIFNVGGVLVRNVEPRNTPSSVNSAFNHRNFWDGRARNEFNGVNPFGDLDARARVVSIRSAANGLTVRLISLSVPRLSTASQADGPPLSDLEMSFAGRRFADVGRKMLDSRLTPLGQQLVAKDDSVLGGLSRSPRPGLSARYLDLVQKAFQDEWWNAPGFKVDLSSGSPVIRQTNATGQDLFTIPEYNFSLYFGFAVAEYERTLVSDQTPFDLFMEGTDTALGAQQQAGLEVFLAKGRCINCHGSPLFSNASFKYVQDEGPLSRMIMGDGRVAVYDEGFYNIGVRPTAEDIGVGGTAPSGSPLSFSRNFQKCVTEKVAAGSTVALANARCEVPRIQAKPAEAAILLEKAAAMLNSSSVTALLQQADAILSSATPDLCTASSLLAQARDLMAADPAATPGVKDLLAPATSLLPDPLFPGQGCLYGPFLRPDERVAVDGAFKVPGLRNVELSAPYFQNGGQGTLEQVVQFYDRGGDFHDVNKDNLDPDIQNLGLTADESSSLVTFLVALTDERVRRDGAPFDHPSLSLPNGGTPGAFTSLNGVPVLDDRVVLPAVGAGGSDKPLGTARSPFANFPDLLK